MNELIMSFARIFFLGFFILPSPEVDHRPTNYLLDPFIG
jgi:hypothetical protein